MHARPGIHQPTPSGPIHQYKKRIMMRSAGNIETSVLPQDNLHVIGFLTVVDFLMLIWKAGHLSPFY